MVHAIWSPSKLLLKNVRPWQMNSLLNWLKHLPQKWTRTPFVQWQVSKVQQQYAHWVSRPLLNVCMYLQTSIDLHILFTHVCHAYCLPHFSGFEIKQKENIHKLILWKTGSYPVFRYSLSSLKLRVGAITTGKTHSGNFFRLPFSIKTKGN